MNARLRALRELGRGLVSLAALVTLAAGVPVGLVALAGDPLPHAVRWSAVAHALGQSQYPDAALIKGAALVCWAAWAVLMLCVVVELFAWIRGRAAARLPLVGPVQVWAGRLVASALLLFSSLGGLVRPAVAAPMPQRAPVVRGVQAPQGPPRLHVVAGTQSGEERAVAAAPAQPTPAGAKHYVVQPPSGRNRDTLWGIAERHLGHGERWKEIFSINKGRTSAGRTLTSPHWIYPGEELLMPADAVGLDNVVLPAVPPSSVPESPPSPAPAAAPSSVATPLPMHHAATASGPQVAAAAPAAKTPVVAAGPAVAASSAPSTAPLTVPSLAPVARTVEDAAGATSGVVHAAGIPGLPAVPRAVSGPTVGAPPQTVAPPATAPAPRPVPAPPVAAAPTISAPAAPLNGSTSPTTLAPLAPPPLRVARGDEAPRPLRAPSRSTSVNSQTISAAKDSGRRARLAETLGVGMLGGAGVIAVLSRLRRAQQRHRRPGHHIRLPGAELARAEVLLRREADLDEATFLDQSLRSLAAGLADESFEPPAVLGVHLTARSLEVLLGEATPSAPVGFRVSADGLRWTLDRGAVDELAPPGALNPLPGLVTLGRTDRGLLMANLEAAGVTSMFGGAGATELVRRAGLELATSSARGNDAVEVILVGFGHGMEPLEGVRVVDDVDEVLEEIEAWSQASVDSVEALGCGTTLGSRVDGYDGEASPLVVVCDTAPVSAETMERLVAAAVPERSAVAVLVAGPAKGAQWRLRLTRDVLEVPQLGFSVTVEGQSEVSVGDAVELVAIAADKHDVDELPDDWSWDSHDVADHHGHGHGHDVDHDHVDDGADHQASSSTSAATSVQVDPGPYVDDRFDVEVRVLGPVEIAGGDRPIERGKSIELVVRLAMNRRGATSAELEADLWPERAPAAGTLNTTTTNARAPLGRGADGQPYVLNVDQGRDRNRGALRKVSSLVTSDYERFMARVGHAEHRPVLGAIETLREALELVRGRPFQSTPVGGYEWALTGLTETIRRGVVDAAVRLSELYLEVGDAEGARWAADAGALADPHSEVLARAAMTAAGLVGDHSGVDAVMRGLVAQVDEDVQPYDDIEPETVELYRELQGHRPSVALAR